MNKFIVLSLSIAFLFASCKSDKKADSKEAKTKEVKTAIDHVASTDSNNNTHFVDIATSKLFWKAFKPTGTHNGTVNLKEGGVLYEGKMLKGGSFEFDMTQIIDLDMPQEDKYNQKLITHLKNSDFFDVQVYPTASFTITEASQTNLTGDLTIKGITKSISFPISLTEKDGGLQLTAKPFMVDRTAFNIQYKSKKFFDNLKDKFINDEFEIAFELYLK